MIKNFKLSIRVSKQYFNLACHILLLQDWLEQVQAMVNQLVTSKQLLGTMDLNIQQMKQEVRERKTGGKEGGVRRTDLD